MSRTLKVDIRGDASHAMHALAKANLAVLLADRSKPWWKRRYRIWQTQRIIRRHEAKGAA